MGDSRLFTMSFQAFVSVLVGLQRELPRKNFDVQLAYSIVFRAVVFGVLGAKIYYVIEFRDLSAFSGLVWYGGLIAMSKGDTVLAIDRFSQLSDNKDISIQMQESINNQLEQLKLMEQAFDE